MTHKQTSIVAWTLLMTLLAAVGCQTRQAAPPPPTGPMHEGYTRPRNPYFLPKPILALESGEMTRLARAAGEGPGQRSLAWYDVRNDDRLAVQSGYRGSTFETIYTQTYDRQYQHGGNIHDHYNQTTRRGSFSQTVR